MPEPILHDFFNDLVPGCYHDLNVQDEGIITYVTNLLERFVRSANLFPADSTGRRLEDIGAMQLQADPIFGTAKSFEEERTIHRQAGDTALWFAGFFPESSFYRARQNHRVQSTGELIKAGKHSYYVVSCFDVFEHAAEAPLFGKLSRQFERCVEGLNRVRQEIDYRRYAIG